MRVFGDGNIKLDQPQLTLRAFDNWGNQLYPTFYIDGDPFSTGNVRMTPDTYSFDVSDVYGYAFDHYYFDYGSSTHSDWNREVNDLSIPCDCVLTVYYYSPYPPPTTHDLTVLAIDNYGQPGYVPLYIDSQYVGTTGFTYAITEGTHSIYVESPIYNQGYTHIFAAYYYDGDYDYNNPTSISLTQDKTVTACYYTYW